jgi:hypothetical protein
LETFTPKQIEAFTMLAAGYSDIETAAKCGVTNKTISRWKAREDFSQLLRESSAKMFDAAISELCLGAIEATRELRYIITNPDVASRTKISAIQVLLTMASRAKEESLERRLDAIEASLDDVDKNEN